MSTNLLSASELDRLKIEALIVDAEEYVGFDGTINIDVAPVDTTCMGGLLFFETSVRTRIGFEVAAWKLGVKTISLTEAKVNDTMSAAESLADTVRTLDPLVDFFCVRHPDPAAFDQITPYTDHPVINCGNGTVEHPTQALIDVYSIWKHFGRLDGLEITMIGALRYSRAARSLITLLRNFNEVSITAVAEPDLHLEPEDLRPYQKSFNKYQRNNYQTATEVDWAKQEVVYSAGFPPITPAGKFSQAVRDNYRITTDIVDAMDERAIVMNPLPRIDEITTDVDDRPQAYYFRQNELALPMRMAILKTYCLQS